MKVLITLFFSLFCTYTITAQSVDMQSIIGESWIYSESTPGTIQQNVSKTYNFRFLEDGNGLLSISLQFDTEGEDALLFGFYAPFSYKQLEAESLATTDLKIIVDYRTVNTNQFGIQNPRRQQDHDETILSDLIDSFSNQTFTYELEATGKYLVVEGFSQNTQSSFTYFESDPVARRN